MFSVVGFIGGEPGTPALVMSVLPLKFVVSTASVLPSQWPRDSPNHSLMDLSSTGRPSVGMRYRSGLEAFVPGVRTLLRGGEFLIGHEPAVTVLLLPLEGRTDQMVEGPDALKIRLAPWRFRLLVAGIARRRWLRLLRLLR